jgi:hypothetical protein
MHQRNLIARIENAERVADATLGHTYSGGCICFPKNEAPFFGLLIEEQIAAEVKCPLHGERFKTPRFHVYVACWLREKLWKLLYSHHSEQYRKAWNASFPPELWPAEEELSGNGEIFLRLKDGTRLLACGSALEPGQFRGTGGET